MIGVCIVTYNEEKYIAQCIESALTQECTEPVRVYVANDCSTDNTASVCRSYRDKIIFIDRENNLGLVGNTMALLEQIRKDGCEYVAMLDGDDYWCDNLKLQKQIDYLRHHPEYGLVHTCVDLLYHNGLKRDLRTSALEGDVFQRINDVSIGNCSVLFRTELLSFIDFAEFQTQGFRSVDYVMYCIFASKTQFGFLPDHTAVWRRGHESVSSSQNVQRQIDYVQNDLAMWHYLALKFPHQWSYSEDVANNYLHARAFNIAFRLRDRHRAIEEWKNMSTADKQKYKLKYFVAHSVILTRIWHKLKDIER